MVFEHLAIDAVTEADLQNLIDQKVSEGTQLDYKRELYRGNGEGKREALKDVSGLANASGGHLIIGMAEEKGLPTELVGLDGNPDEATTRLQNLFSACFEPRIIGLTVRPILLASGRFAIIIRVPKSWNSPHGAKHEGPKRFYVRHSSSTDEASMDELRALFTAASTLSDRIRRFREARVSKIGSNETPIAVHAGGRLILHVIPFAAYEGLARYDLAELFRHGYSFAPLGGGGGNRWWNLEGCLVASPNGHRYSQLDRNGIVEGVRGDLLRPMSDGKQGVYARNIQELVLASISPYLQSLQSLGVPTPIVVLLSMQGIRGSSIIGDPYGSQVELELRSDDLFFPEVVIEEFGSPHQYALALKPIFDAVWNAAGCEEAPA